MTNEEILRSYRQAQDKEKQIEILSDLNLCSKARIVDILSDGGVDPKELPWLPRYKSDQPDDQDQPKFGKGGRRWVWNPNQKTTKLDRFQQAKERYKHLKKAYGEGDPYVIGFKACVDFMEGK